MSDVGLYYPYLHFRDDAWLKRAVLYWERVDRILPAFPTEFFEFAPDDSEVVAALKSEGYVDGMRPEQEATRVGKSFLEFIRNHEKALFAKYDVSKVSEWEINPEPQRVSVNEPIPTNVDRRFTYVAEGKMPRSLCEALVNTGLAAKSVYEAGLWFLGMHHKLASVYMTALAEEITARRDHQPITEDPKLHVAVTGCTLERIAQALLGDDYKGVVFADTKKRQDEAETYMASLCLKTVMPKNVEGLGVDKIIEFKRARHEEMGQFRSSLESFVTDLEWLDEVKDRGQMEKNLQAAYKKRIAPQLKEAKGFFKNLGVGTVLSTIALSPATFSSALGSLTGLPLEPVSAAVSNIAIAMLPVLYGSRWMAREKVGSVAYLLHVEEDLNPSTLSQRILCSARDFCFDVRQT